jgi:hypothetical protein
VILKFMSEPLVPTFEHSQFASFECANIWFQITKNVLPTAY